MRLLARSSRSWARCWAARTARGRAMRTARCAHHRSTPSHVHRARSLLDGTSSISRRSSPAKKPCSRCPPQFALPSCLQKPALSLPVSDSPPGHQVHECTRFSAAWHRWRCSRPTVALSHHLPHQKLSDPSPCADPPIGQTKGRAPWFRPRHAASPDPQPPPSRYPRDPKPTAQNPLPREKTTRKSPFPHSRTTPPWPPHTHPPPTPDESSSSASRTPPQWSSAP